MEEGSVSLFYVTCMSKMCLCGIVKIFQMDEGGGVGMILITVSTRGPIAVFGKKICKCIRNESLIKGREGWILA